MPRTARASVGDTNVPSSSHALELLLKPYPPEVQQIALAANNVLLKALPGAELAFDETAKVIGYGYGPGYKGLVCTLLLSKGGVKIGVAYGAELPDPNRLMRGTGKVHRHVPLTNTDDLKHPGLKSVLKAALTAWKKRN